MNKIIVENDTMRFYSIPAPIPVGGNQWSKIFFTFSDEWEDLRKIAQFRQGELKKNVDIDSDNFCFVPEGLLSNMCGEISIVGYPQDTASAIKATANSLMLNFVQGFESDGEPAVPPTPDLYQKLINEFKTESASDSVLYTKQELNDTYKQQARENINAWEAYNGAVPVKCNYTNLVNQKPAMQTLYVIRGQLFPPDDSVSDEVKIAWNHMFMTPFGGFRDTAPSYMKSSAKDIATLVANNIFGKDFIGTSGNVFEATNNMLGNGHRLLIQVGSVSKQTINVYYYYSDGTYRQISYTLSTDAFGEYVGFKNPLQLTASKINDDVALQQQFMSSNPTADMHIATKQYVDTSKAEAQQLGITAATVGQTIRVKAVDDAGKPTEWEAVDMLGGGGDEWELIASGEVAEAANLSITKDSNGEAFLLKAAQLLVDGPLAGNIGQPIAVMAERYNSGTDYDRYFVEQPLASASPTVRMTYTYFKGVAPILVSEMAASTIIWSSNDCQVRLATHRAMPSGYIANRVATHNINSIYCGSQMGNVTLGAGCKYWLYGVRA